MAPDASDESAAPVVQAFDWPVPGQVSVTHEMFTNGKSDGVVRYTVEIRRRADAAGFTMCLVDPEVPDSSPADMGGVILGIFGSVPRIDVTPDGRWDPDATAPLLEEIVEEEIRSAGAGGAAADAIRSRYANANWARRYAVKAEMQWGAWAGHWVALDVPVGGSRRFAGSTPFGMELAEVPAEAVVTNHGPVDDDPGLVRFTRVVTSDPLEVRSEVITDPDTLRPWRAVLESSRRGGAVERSRREEFTFDW